MILIRKKYTAPQIEIVEFVAPELMIGASGQKEQVGAGDKEVGDDTDDLSRRKRGTWGNLWE